MLYRAKSDKDIGVKGCKVVGIGDVFGYELIQNFFVDNSGFGSDDEPALTFSNFLTKVKAGYFYGIRDVGQFQVNIGEFKKIAKPRAEILAEQGIVSSKLIKNNTRLTIYKNGDKVLRLHSTDIIKWQGNKIILNSGGWDTMTTRARFNEFLPDRISIFRKKGVTYIKNSLKYPDEITEFSDGIEINL
jgi:hypothetical protein